MFKLGLPVNHSGQNVIHLGYPTSQLVRGASSVANDLPSVQLRGTQYDDPVMTGRIVLDNLVENIAAKRSSTEDGQYFKRYDRWVRNTPAGVCQGILLP